RLLLGVLVVWRVTHLVNAEDGPGDVIVRIRRAVGDGFIGRLLDCFYCASLWIALPVALVVGETAIERALLWPALSAGGGVRGTRHVRARTRARPSRIGRALCRRQGAMKWRAAVNSGRRSRHPVIRRSSRAGHRSRPRS